MRMMKLFMMERKRRARRERTSPVNTNPAEDTEVPDDGKEEEE